jgi:hypothetical protein
MRCSYLTGTNIAPRTAKQARALIGRNVTYLQKADIDRSGRGFFFPRAGRIADVSGRNIAIDSPDNFVIYLPDLVEMTAQEEESKQ